MADDALGGGPGSGDIAVDQRGDRGVCARLAGDRDIGGMGIEQAVGRRIEHQPDVGIEIAVLAGTGQQTRRAARAEGRKHRPGACGPKSPW